MLCSRCHSDNEAGAKFCGICGAELTAHMGELYCPACGAANAEGSSYCGECGTTLVSGLREKAGTTSDTVVVSRRSTSWAWWLLPVFFAWVGGLIAWAIVRGVDSGKAKGLLILGIVMTLFWPLVWLVIVVILSLLTVTPYWPYM